MSAELCQIQSNHLTCPMSPTHGAEQTLRLFDYQLITAFLLLWNRAGVWFTPHIETTWNRIWVDKF